MQGGRKQYGLQLQIKGPPKKQPTARPSPAAAFRFNDGDDDEGNVEADIARQAHKKRNVREVEQQYQKALEEDPTAFDYDGVYDEMKGNQARPIHEDRAKREPKYIAKLLEKAKVRAREQDIVYERQLAKEREKEDHLFGDKEKFVTGAYKKKLQEQAKWLEEERRREAQEQRHEVTNKSDMSDFYRNLLKGNVAFGANNVRKPGEKPSVEAEKDAERPVPQVEDEEQPLPSSTTAAPVTGASRSEEARDIESSSTPVASSSRSRDTSDEQRSGAQEKSAERSLGKEEVGDVPKDVKQPVEDVNEPVEAAKQPPIDPVAAAKERYLARKRQRGL